MWTWRRCAEAALVALLAACADEGAEGLPGFDLGPEHDAAPRDAVVCPPGELEGPDGCRPLPSDVCPLVDELGIVCTDRDGDCYVTDCPGAPAVLVDCDDGRADVAPDVPELCDGIDNDCDGLADDGYVLGGACEACGSGKVECSAVDARATACSTAAGQSEAVEALPEACNDVDDDCDGAVDEGCRLDRPALSRAAVAICGDTLLAIEGEALVRIPLAGGEAEVLDAGPVAWPACEGDVLAWIKPDPGAPCGVEPGGPARCPRGRLFARAGDGSTRDLTGLADLGPPEVSEGVVYWHTVLGAGPVLQRRAPEGAIEPLFEGASASDPTAVRGGRVAVRTWEGAVPRVAVRGLDGERDLRVEGPPAPAGPPALDGAWVVWVLEGMNPAVWAVPLERAREGFQVTVAGHPTGRPWLDGGRLYWLDADGLRRFDLATGQERLVVPGLTEPEQVDVRGGRVAWVEGDGLFLRVED